ncbi:MAG TPA: hypothetical protein VGH19_03995 [Verrucomicrobiae bacterium]
MAHDAEWCDWQRHHSGLNAARLWTEVSSEQKQQVLFLEGVTCSGGEFESDASCPLFKLSRKARWREVKIGDPTGIRTPFPVVKGLFLIYLQTVLQFAARFHLLGDLQPLF